MATLGDYFNLTKPRIMLLVLMTGFPAILMAAKGFPDWSLILVTLLGTALASGAASAMNHYIDRDIDAVMERTSGRPLPAGKVPPVRALWFGLVLSALSIALLWWKTNWLAAFVAGASIFYYVVIYTMWLKRATPQNIVIGGAAGASAPLIAWAAVTQEIGLAAWLMFLIIFLWTPPHFWALALYRKDDYAKAGVPMLPVVAGVEETRWQIFLYTLVMLVATVALFPIQESGLFYLISAILLGAVFLLDAWRVYRRGTDEDAKRLFGYSIIYLFLLFIALSVDALIRTGSGVV